MPPANAAHRIDVHHHLLPPLYMRALGDRIGPQGLLGPPPKWDASVSLEAMDRNGIAAAVTSISAPGFWFGDTQEAQKLVRHCNDYAATLRRDHAGRFGMFAGLPLPAVEESLGEIEHACGSLDTDGFGMFTSYDGEYPGAPRFQPVFEELDRRHAVVFFHPTTPAYGHFPGDIPVPTLEFPFETTRAIVSLLYSGTLARFRNIRFIFAHAGGALPFLVQRIARLTVRPEFQKHVPDGVAAELGRLYFDIALSANRFALGPLQLLVEPTHILFGSDFPHAGEPTMSATVTGLQELELGRDLAAVERDSASQLFPRLFTRSQ